MESEPQQFEPQLIIRKESKLRALNGPGAFWLLIVLVLVLTGFAVSTLDQPRDRTSDPNYEPSSSPLKSSIIDAKKPRIYTVTYKGGVFSPTNLRIHAGDTVRFKNDGFFSIRIASDPDSEHNQIAGFDSIGGIPQGSYFAFTFAAQGIFGYYNVKDADEKGTIIVR
jgi:plastocyanin